MQCKRCEQSLTRADSYCPNCGIKTGVEAKKDFKKSIGFSGVGCSAGILIIAYITYVANNLPKYDNEGNALKGAVFLCLFPAVISGSLALSGLISFVIGKSKKNYKLVRKTK